MIATIPGHQRSETGKVAMVENAVDSTTGMVTVRGVMDNANETLWPGELIDVGQEPEGFDAEDSHRWLPVAGSGSKAAYAVMERFIATIDSPGLASRLLEAISGSGAFRRFQAELSRHDDEYTRWHRFRDDARLGHASAWLADHGYRSSH